MPYKIKSFLYLCCFIMAFAIYSFSVTKTNNDYSDDPEVAVADLDNLPSTRVQEENPQ